MNHTPNELPNALDTALSAISEDTSKTIHLTPQEAAALNRYVTELLGTIGKKDARLAHWRSVINDLEDQQFEEELND